MRKSVFILIFAFLFLVVASGCREEQKIDVTSGIDPKSMATMTTKNVATFISDSGVVQYKVVAPLWKVFEETDTPYWIFPEGLYLQKYDPYFHVIATVAADSARFYSNQKLWRLDGHVEMTKAPSDLFQTSQLFGISAEDAFTATLSYISRQRLMCLRGSGSKATSVLRHIVS